AEDGIRDDLVTGVQTCALPISVSPGQSLWRALGNADHLDRPVPLPAASRPPDRRSGERGRSAAPRRFHEVMMKPGQLFGALIIEIGRASCRERGDVGVVGG